MSLPRVPASAFSRAVSRAASAPVCIRTPASASFTAALPTDCCSESTCCASVGTCADSGGATPERCPPSWFAAERLWPFIGTSRPGQVEPVEDLADLLVLAPGGMQNLGHRHGMAVLGREERRTERHVLDLRPGEGQLP